MVVDAPSALVHLAEAGPRPAIRWWRGCSQLHRAATRPTRADGAAGRIQPRLPARPAGPRPASPTTSAPRAPCSCSAPRSSSTPWATTSPSSTHFRVPYEVLDPDGCIRAEPALALVRASSSAGCGCRATRPATAHVSPSAWPRCRRAGRGVPQRRAIQRPADRGRHGSPASPPTRHRHRRSLRRGAGQLLAGLLRRRSASTCRSIRSRATR